MVRIAQKPRSEMGLDEEDIPPRSRFSCIARDGSPSSEEPEIEKKAAEYLYNHERGDGYADIPVRLV